MVSEVFFVLFCAFFSIIVVFGKTSELSGLSLLMTLFGLSAIYYDLEIPFLPTMQIFIYSLVIVVLLVFILIFSTDRRSKIVVLLKDYKIHLGFLFIAGLGTILFFVIRMNVLILSNEVLEEIILNDLFEILCVKYVIPFGFIAVVALGVTVAVVAIMKSSSKNFNKDELEK